MAASLPGSTPAQNLANPSAGVAVLMSPFSGPQGSAFSGRTITAWTGGTPTYTQDVTNMSTGGLNTGIGFGSPPIIGPTAPGSITAAGYNDDYTPGVDFYNSSASKQTATTSILTAIGGGRSNIVNGTGPNGNGTPPGTNVSSPVPYNAQPLLMAGNGGSRDAGAGPIFTGFGIKTVTATATVANGAVVEAGFTNRSGVSITNGQSVFGSYVAASQAVA
jgi:hypothetical protein